MPIVVKTNPASPEMTIPAVLNNQDSTRAVISVEVKDKGDTSKRRKRNHTIEKTQWSDPLTRYVISAAQVTEGMVLIIRRVVLTAIDVAGGVAVALSFAAGMGRIPNRRGEMIEVSSAARNRQGLVRAA